MKMRVLLILMIVLSTPMFSVGQKNAEAERILKAASDKAESYKTVDTKFEFVVENIEDKSKQKYAGELWVKDDRFKMSMEQSITFCDGKSRWVYLPEVNEVNVSKLYKDDDLDPEDRFLVDPMSVFSVYKSGFKYSISGTQDIKGEAYSVVTLSPEDIEKPYFKIKIWISDDNDYFSVKYFQKDGTRITLYLIDFESNKKFKDSFFGFKNSDYPDVEVIDMR